VKSEEGGVKSIRRWPRRIAASWSSIFGR